MALREEALELHLKNRGKVAVLSKVKVENQNDLSLAYSPGVAEPCKEIEKDPNLSYVYTNRGNMVAVVSDGTAVLGLGDIGAEAALPVMEGKAILFKSFADVDAFPICLNTKEVSEVVQAVKWLEPTFGGVNLEDISGPRCFEIEEQLKNSLKIPVFHDDQHGTAVVTFAGVINALKLIKKDITQVKVVINGAGAAGISIAKLLEAAGVNFRNIRICDSKGVLYPGIDPKNKYKEEIALLTNPEGEKGTLKDVMIGADIFIGVSVANVVTKEMVASMAPNAIVFALANPVPEIMPEDALAAGAAVVGTGRSDFPNQVNNVLGFPGIFRGALDVRASEINERMKVAAAQAIANLITDAELSPEYVIPKPFDRRVVPAVALAVAQAAMETGVAREPKTIAELTQGLKKRGLI
ncbi:MAG TPA: malic enzyme-like NAD(P)-binding protein [Bacillota bacterium]|nr:malic enzyme-like NAD(P)-binding protein [Bacillota bacterium]HOL09488.1 malic enzyme-like NAD(P)-binding protein [Bacillota bacterium]HPO97550.1 malic enzyme-like NAD(P)-binding protein [Bacillota bacterium]